MLEHTYPSKRPKPVTAPVVIYTNPTTYQLEQSARRFNCTVYEFKRRDAIVRSLYRACRYRAGDRVVLTDKTIPYTETGDVTVRHIVETYSGMGHEEPWPPSDNPFLVTIAYSANPTSVIRCTTNYVELEQVSMGVC
jgi:hypothetical protein